MKRFKCIPCLFLMVMIQSTVVMANDLQSPLEGHWVRAIPEVLNHVEDKTFESMTVYADQNDYAVFEVQKENTETSVLCHYHIDNDSSHCNLVDNGYEQTGDFELIVSVSDQDILVLLQKSGISMDVISDPVWPWVVGAVVTYYAAKKAINYWVHKTFTPKPHVHAQFFIPKEDLEDRNNDLIFESQERFNKLNQITSSVVHPTELLFKGAVVNALLEEKILSLTKGLLTDVTQYCTVCKTTHSEFDTHFDFKSSQTSFSNPITPNFDFNIQSSSEAKSQFQVLVESATTQHESRFSKAKTMIEQGLVVRSTKAVLMDLKKELVNPLILLFRGTTKLISDKQNIKQLNSFVQTSFNASLGESNYVAASSIALSLVSIKILGESIESIFVGPYHILCQVSDAAVVAAGLGMFSAYHNGN